MMLRSSAGETPRALGSPERGLLNDEFRVGKCVAAAAASFDMSGLLR